MVIHTEEQNKFKKESTVHINWNRMRDEKVLNIEYLDFDADADETLTKQ